MRIFSAAFDAILLPIEVAKDIFNPWPMLIDGEKSKTRDQIEKIENDLNLR